jgi:hypothetical protein
MAGISSDDNVAAVRLMREQRPTPANREELLALLDKTRNERRTWICKNHPSITDILLKYPRLKDIPEAVSFLLSNLFHLSM